MYDIIKFEYREFLKYVTTGHVDYGLYLDIDDYEDEYSHDEIRKAQFALANKIRDYLKEHFPNEYCVSVDWCVRVMRVNWAKKVGIRKYLDKIVQ